MRSASVSVNAGAVICFDHFVLSALHLAKTVTVTTGVAADENRKREHCDRSGGRTVPRRSPSRHDSWVAFPVVEVVWLIERVIMMEENGSERVYQVNMLPGDVCQHPKWRKLQQRRVTAASWASRIYGANSKMML